MSDKKLSLHIGEVNECTINSGFRDIRPNGAPALSVIGGSGVIGGGGIIYASGDNSVHPHKGMRDVTLSTAAGSTSPDDDTWVF